MEIGQAKAADKNPAFVSRLLCHSLPVVLGDGKHLVAGCQPKLGSKAQGGRHRRNLWKKPFPRYHPVKRISVLCRHLLRLLTMTGSIWRNSIRNTIPETESLRRQLPHKFSGLHDFSFLESIISEGRSPHLIDWKKATNYGLSETEEKKKGSGDAREQVKEFVEEALAPIYDGMRKRQDFPHAILPYPSGPEQKIGFVSGLNPDLRHLQFLLFFKLGYTVEVGDASTALEVVKLQIQLLRLQMNCEITPEFSRFEQLQMYLENSILLGLRAKVWQAEDIRILEHALTRVDVSRGRKKNLEIFSAAVRYVVYTDEQVRIK